MPATLIDPVPGLKLKMRLWPQGLLMLACLAFGGEVTRAATNYQPFAVTTLAGLAGSAGSANGTGSAARFNDPHGAAVDSSGNVYVGDWGNNTIRKITPGGMVTTLAGLAGSAGSTNGTGSAARFDKPVGVAVDSATNIYVADTYNNTIRKIAPGGVVTTLAGLAGMFGSADGTGSEARFYYPAGVAVDSATNVYVADGGNSIIRKITPDGVVSTFAGLAESTGSADGTGSEARFYNPAGVAVDHSTNVYVADTYNHTIRRITPDGAVTTLAGMPGISGAADGTGREARFYYPYGIALDPMGNVYVGDWANHTVRKITPGGVVTTLAGLPGISGSANGGGSAARFDNPSGIGLDSAGDIYVADTFNNTIRKAGAPVLTIVHDGSGGFFIRFQGMANFTYQLRRAETLNGQWNTNGAQTAPASGQVQFHDTSPPLSQAFYRVFQQ